MHDLHLANQIVKLAREYARQHDASLIKKISIELGDIIEHGENIAPENLEYNINLLLPNTKVMIEKISGTSWRLVEIEVG